MIYIGNIRMKTLVIFKYPATLLSLARRFPLWYFGEVPAQIIKGYGEYFRVLGEIFSFWFLIKTLLNPWKSISEKYPDKGFNISLIAQAFTLNCTSRVIGFLFRTTALAIGIVCEVVVFGAFCAILFVWLTFPLILILDILYLFSYLT